MLKKFLKRLTQPAEDTSPEQLTALAAAALLLEVSWADHDIAPAELASMEQALQQQFRLDGGAARALVEQSRREQENSVGLYDYTRVINENWEEPRKFELVRALWQLAYSDHTLDRYEEYTIRKIAELLYLSHERFIEAKLQAKSTI